MYVFPQHTQKSRFDDLLLPFCKSINKQQQICRYFARGTLTFVRESGNVPKGIRKVSINSNKYVGISTTYAKKHIRQPFVAILQKYQ